jgi:limonene-1,2-epoxide hydrolase
MTEQTSDVTAVNNVRTVEAFLYALRDEDFDTAASMLDENLVWQNVGLPTIRGRDRVVKLFRAGQGRVGFDVKIHHVAADGATVLTERTDALIVGRLRAQFWVCGTFEVHDGRITLWRDHFDFFEFFVKAPARAIAATVFPSLQPAF